MTAMSQKLLSKELKINLVNDLNLKKIIKIMFQLKVIINNNHRKIGILRSIDKEVTIIIIIKTNNNNNLSYQTLIKTSNLYHQSNESILLTKY